LVEGLHGALRLKSVQCVPNLDREAVVEDRRDTEIDLTNLTPVISRPQLLWTPDTIAVKGGGAATR